MFLLISSPTHAQERYKWLKTTPNPQKLDSISVSPQSIKIISPNNTVNGSLNNVIRLKYNILDNSVFFVIDNNSTNILPDSLLVAYRLLAFDFSKTVQKRSSEKTDSLGIFRDIYVRPVAIKDFREEIFSTENLQKTGTLSRGISVGNQQGAVVNSALNLQLEGKISENLNIKAVISDQNVPFQPEGNTAQIQNFDRIFIELQTKKSTFTIGDIVMKNAEKSEFLRFYKNVQGIQAEVKYNIKDTSLSKIFGTKSGFFGDSKAITTFGVALAKGKFASTNIVALEGVQGPYRLRGALNERFIIVLAASEKIYVDGKLLKRGFNEDYTIDYNQAEITFTPNVIITQFTRIRVDFEYSERNYSRTNLQFAHSQEWKKFDVMFNFYSESDNPRNPLVFELDNATKTRLSEIGDNLTLATLNGAEETPFSSNLVLYQKRDIEVLGIIYPDVLVAENEPNKPYFRVSFSDVGAKKGNYILKNTTANGRVYEWVAPVANVPQGNFEPFIFVPLPQKKQMMTFGTSYNLSETAKISTEIAFSQRDINRYSPIDDTNNNGFAGKIGYKNTGALSKIEGYKWFSEVSFEHNNAFFLPIDRYRSIEFNRDWSLDLDTLTRPVQNADNIAQTSISLQKDAQNYLKAGFNYRNRAEQTNGFQQTFNISQKISAFVVEFDAFSLRNNQTIQVNNQEQTQTAKWERQSLDISHTPNFGRFKKIIIKPLLIGYIFSRDENTITTDKTDFVQFSAMNFVENKIYLKNIDSTKLNFLFDIAKRDDKTPILGKLTPTTSAYTANSKVQKTWKNHVVNATATYREVKSFLPLIPSLTNLTSRLDLNNALFNKLIRSELTLQTASGREARREFSYLQVPTGQGTHTWRDDNNDKKQDLNEFYLAINPDEKNYIKIFTPTDAYSLVFTNIFNYRLNFSTSTKWKNNKGIKLFFSKISGLFVINTNRRQTDAEWVARIVPFLGNDAALLARQDVWRGTLFFNRSSPKFGADVAFLQSNQRQLLTNGFEARQNTEYQLNTRKNLSTEFNLQIATKFNQLKNRSDFLLNRNYAFSGYQISPTLAYQPNNDFRLTASYTFASKLADAPASVTPVPPLVQESAKINQMMLEMRWNKLSSRNLTAFMKYIAIDFVGEVNSPIGYEMLEALQNGKNYVWNINFQQKLASGLQINISYDGRKSPDRPVVHLGRVQIAVLF